MFLVYLVMGTRQMFFDDDDNDDEEVTVGYQIIIGQQKAP